MRVISAEEAAWLVKDNWTIVPGGFGSCGHPDALSRAIGQRFQGHGHPRSLSLLFASAPGDGMGRGADLFAHVGLVSRAIGGFWGFVPGLGEMARKGQIEAHNWPQGVMSQLFRAIAAGQPGVLSRIGLNTFVDPDLHGGRLNKAHGPALVKKLNAFDQPMLFYPSQRVDCALLRGSFCDSDGNISMQNEVSYSDALAQAMAARNSGGIVVVQVEHLVGRHEIAPYDVRIPGMLVDYVVVSASGDHPQTYGDAYDPEFTRAGHSRIVAQTVTTAERIIARRALQELKSRSCRVVNLGIGIPALIGQVAMEDGQDMPVTLTVESGQIGGTPAQGLSFGASRNPAALVEPAALFEFYEGGGLDATCLGFAELDSGGNVNVSRFGSRLKGAGGFINISQSAKNVFFCGTFTANGLETECDQGRLRIVAEGRARKFVSQVSHRTFSGTYAHERQQNVRVITERAVFSIKNGTVFLDEIAPGISVNDDIIANINGSFVISGSCRNMDYALFR